MFDRIGRYFVVIVNNVRALERISVILYGVIKKEYFIQTEVFPNITVYKIHVDMEESLDEKITKLIKEDLLETNGIKLWEES